MTTNGRWLAFRHAGGSRTRRRRGSIRLSVLVAAAALALAACLDPAPPMSKPATGAVMDDPFADPFVMRIDDTYHAWGTGYTNWPFFNLIYSSSTGGIHDWTEVQDAMPSIPSWAVQSAAANFWAPSVLQRGPNDFLLYFTAQTKDWYAVVNGEPKGPVWCIGVAHASQPEGPFTDVRDTPLVCQVERYGSIDPDVLQAPDGQLYLYWKSEGYGVGDVGRLWAQQLSSDGTSMVPGTRHQLLAPAFPWEGFVLENPSMTYRDGNYWLFYSGHDWWTSSYATGVAHCTSPLGPCTRSWSTPMLGSSWNVAGPGGAAPVRGQNDLLAFAAWESGAVGYDNGGERRLYFVDWSTSGGRPYVP